MSTFRTTHLVPFHFICLIAASMLFAWGAAPQQRALAHEGHDHGAAPPPLPTSVKPRVTVHSDVYELVAVANEGRLTIFLDRYSDNAPVADATIEVLAGAETVKAELQSDSTYRAAVPGLDTPGRHELVFNILAKEGDDLLAGTLEVFPPDAGTAAGPLIDGRTPWWPTNASSLGVGHLALIAAAALGLGFAIGRGTKRKSIAGLAAAALVFPAGDYRAHAHQGHGPTPSPSPESLSGDVPRRLPDGSVFLPKPSQRLLTVRTEIAVEEEAASTATLVGRIITDPNRSGIVQSIGGGLVSAPPSGLPRLGQAVKAGETLATVTRGIPLEDQSTLAERGRELEGQILLSEQRLTRLNRLSSDAVARAQIDDVALEIANLKKRLQTLGETKIQPEVLVAPIDGIISASRVVAGQVVQAQDVLYQIVDPESLWVEALVFDQIDPGAISGAVAVVGEGERVELRLEGRGRTLQNQAIVLHFSIRNAPAGAVIGMPVTVLARDIRRHKGVLLPRDAVVLGAAGESTVWQHIDPERFIARQVRVEPFDGERVLVTGGISPTDRIVVHGAELLSQVR